MKKLLSLVLIISFIYILLGNLQIQHVTNNQIEEEGIRLLDKTLAIANEIDEFGENTKLNKTFVQFGKTQNRLTDGLNQFINFCLFPITLGMSLINLTTNCISILTGIEYRVGYSTTSAWYHNDFTSGSSYGGGGGGINGGR